eukprot:CAMPEP_0196820636 /NCGR_PEP_ID=MMETSP1362-20130617/76177_1 /TAXON_ID=163516 /ORGANISM="Leptocylindrus danicus, Strain CCMP1856" /LENGTH=302 /DNA_ID=CAMNT_0042199597 /DNA_START=398 /DNA_END=1303 /DNA_ORIENTATION=-
MLRRAISSRAFSSICTTRTDSGIVNVKLNNPDKLNALDLPTFEALADIAKSLRDDKGARVVIISGSGRAFCTGLNMKAVLFSNESSSSAFPSIRNISRLLERSEIDPVETGKAPPALVAGNLAQNVGYLWRQLPIPVIAVLHGMCYGGGMQIALGADMRYSTPDCKLSIMEAKWGLIPDMSASITLRELVRMDVAKELTMTGRIFSGEEAMKLGLVTRCAENPMDEAEKVAAEIISRSPDSVASTKKLFHDTWFSDEQRCLDVETELQKQLIGSWNQVAASARNVGIQVPYKKRNEVQLSEW